MEMVKSSEFEAAENEAKISSGNYTHEFAKPFVYADKSYDKMEFDFEKLTGKDFLEIEAEMQAQGKPLIAPEFSGDFMLLMASRASGVPSDVLQALPLSTFKRIHSKARSFLLKQGL